MDEDEVSANPFDEEETDTPISFDKEADEDTDEEGLGELPSIVQRRGGGKNKVWTAQIMTVVILTMVTMIILAMVTMMTLLILTTPGPPPVLHAAPGP